MKRSFHFTRGPEDAPEEVRREIELHLELRAREFEAQGMSPEAARRAALEAFGDRSAIESEVSEMRGTTLRERGRRDRLGELMQDVRIAIRGLTRAPGFTTVALLTLAIGIGANSAIFGVVRSVLLRPLPYPEADRLVQLWSDHRAKGRAAPEWLTPPQFKDWQSGSRTFAAMAGYQRWAPDLTGSGEPESLNGYAVSSNFFDVLGVNVARGRGFQAADDDAGAERVVILSDELWRRRFAADTAVLGRVIQLNSEPWTVIGVLPAGFKSPVLSDVWRPTRRPATSGCGRGCVVVRAIGRLKPGVTLAEAKADLDAIQRRLGQEYPETDARVGAWPIALHEQLTGPARPGLLALSGALLFVLLIGCVNLANLLLLRCASRAREMSVRAALGAGRGRLLRQLLTESLVLAAAGGWAGLALGWWGTGLLRAVVPPAIRAVQEIRLDGGAVAFTAGLTLAAGLLFGLVPALHAARPDLMTALRTGREGGRRGHLLRDGLVVAELALAVVLLVGAGLLGRSFLALQRVDLGYRTDSVVVASVFFPKARYADPARALVAENEILSRLRQSPAVRGAEASDQPPLLGGGDQDMTVNPVGEPLPDGRPFAIWYRAVSAGYTRLMGMRLVSGRTFTPEDRMGAVPVGIVNEEAARRMWKGRSPIGRQVRTGDVEELTIVGVVATGKPDGPNQPVKAELFFPLDQFPDRAVSVLIEPRRDVASAVAAMRAALAAVDPDVALTGAVTMAEQAGQTVALPWLYALLVGIFAAAAVGLAILGVYGVMAYAVAQRQREIGVRLALGAAPGAIRRLVLGRGARLAAIGLGVGLAGAVVTGRLLRTLLFGVSALDPGTFAGVAALLGAMALAACLLPARRAMRVDPLVAIRDE